jgi:hypothetical protein
MGGYRRTVGLKVILRTHRAQNKGNPCAQRASRPLWTDGTAGESPGGPGFAVVLRGAWG